MIIFFMFKFSHCLIQKQFTIVHKQYTLFMNNYLKMTGKFFENNRLVNIQYKHNVRIHVERFFGLLLRMFHIFDGVIPIELLRNVAVTQMYKIVHVCSALTNLSPSVVAFE